MRDLRFRVPGLPRPQGSKRLVRLKNGKQVMIESNANELKTWRRAVAGASLKAAHAAGWQEPYDQPCYVYLIFQMPEPKKGKFSHPAVKPDIDKLTRAVLDGITGTAISDDCRVCQLTVIKRYADASVGPGVTVEVSPL